MAQKNQKVSYNALSEKIADLIILAHQILLQVLRGQKDKAVESSIIKVCHHSRIFSLFLSLSLVF